jgi:hypothetical protein
MDMDMDDGPGSKRLRTEDTLTPEAEFLASHKSPVQFKVIEITFVVSVVYFLSVF